MVIYMVTNEINGKSYVGQTINSLEKRRRVHIWQALSKTDNMYFHKAIRKYGKDSFDWEILHECNDIEELNELEVYYIKLHDTFLGEGYNLNAGGMNALCSKETRKKMSIINSGKNNPMYGKHFSEEAIQKRSGKNHPGARSIIVNNKCFDTITEAAIVLNVTHAAVCYRLKNQWAGYRYAKK